ncbi:hypothetical protein [Cohnella sp. AR92]|uniref:hypothetical protein n=1 Tax=Cohnella sp. AR92 TaxID=648716 RepID=UPI000F8D5C37|nr:hypothetical protein [Cohnella sp. AR92]RUS48218.1 hypothetical protein ELR57_06740 [Cohnella sp. AR92]
MDPTDKELREQLADGPFPGAGFDDRLRKRIEANLDRPARSRPRRYWTFGSAAAVLLAALFIGIWQWLDIGSSGIASEQLAGLSAASQADQTELGKVDEPLQTAMLIGLRKDVDTPDGGSVSTYRTLLVAPEGDEKLGVAAEGQGIVMPYSQSFWMLNGIGDDAGSSKQSLTAYEAYSSKKLMEVPELTASRQGLASEKLLYVGHEYVAVSQEADSTSLSASSKAGAEYRFVQSLKQLSDSLGTAFDPQTEPHTTLEEGLDRENGTVSVVFGNDQQWSVARKNGSWIGTVYRSATGLNPVDVTTEEELAEPLSSRIARNNSLAVDWDSIKSAEPAALDAFTSSNGEVLAIVLDREIKVYPYGRKNAASNAVKIELDPGESVIMVQWSVEQKYTEQWVTKVKEIFQAAAAR